MYIIYYIDIYTKYNIIMIIYLFIINVTCMVFWYILIPVVVTVVSVIAKVYLWVGCSRDIFTFIVYEGKGL